MVARAHKDIMVLSRRICVIRENYSIGEYATFSALFIRKFVNSFIRKFVYPFICAFVNLRLAALYANVLHAPGYTLKYNYAAYKNNLMVIKGAYLCPIDIRPFFWIIYF